VNTSLDTEEHTMRSTKTLAVVTGVAIGVLSASAVLGAGQAGADTEINSITLTPIGAKLRIVNLSKDSATCTYTAIAVDSPLLPYHSLPFHLGGAESAEGSFTDILIPGVPTGTKWIPSVSCNNGGGQATNWVGGPDPIQF
jgi:hypothetical protein